MGAFLRLCELKEYCIMSLMLINLKTSIVNISQDGITNRGYKLVWFVYISAETSFKQTKQRLGRVFNFSTLDVVALVYAICNCTRQPNLQLKTQSKQLLDYLPLACTLHE